MTRNHALGKKLVWATFGVFIIIGVMTYAIRSVCLRKSEKWGEQITKKCNALRNNMTVHDVCQLLGPPGDHTKNPELSSQLAARRAFFDKLDRNIINFPARISRERAPKQEWTWDEGAIVVYFNDEGTLEETTLIFTDEPETYFDRLHRHMRQSFGI